MPIYESVGFGNDLNLFDKKAPFDYIAEFRPMRVPQGSNIDDFKRNSAPYCIAGCVKQDENGNYKRNNASLIYRDLIFLDYDELEASVGFPRIVNNALHGYSYIIYPTIKHTKEKPRYRLVVKPSDAMTEQTYKQTANEIAEKIGLPFDSSSLTWSQLQGLPVTTGNPADYKKIVNRGRDYPVAKPIDNQGTHYKPHYHTPRQSGNKTITMRVLDTLLHGFGDEGGRNVAVTKFVGLLLSKYVKADIPTAYELTMIANRVTDKPLSSNEIDRTFRSILTSEMRKRGIEP
ncbi:primase alpha helix C-terminal domain-containing protein [Streptococcus thermophilus]|uniref:primase alpha helix C-terminal domain-containing protein n=1 Tax=Streptococcus thermophilus TaxID=1308 RepID=UPI0022FDF4E7|nr:primase alpha helix C-terminal domain-containing protein [Streptococcus thermophilus]MDA5520418.1 primase alpha helix C-terminal domain-containing protein [Streptococcus thermophilus]MDW2957681.1 primase alpha helix C-terminal domain-containing protein [Streptococcus thermophilus]